VQIRAFTVYVYPTLEIVFQQGLRVSAPRVLVPRDTQILTDLSRTRWVSKLTSEAATLAFFVVAGFKFRPRHDNPYLKVEEEEDGKEMYETEQVEEP
jgi:hypothetical protein